MNKQFAVNGKGFSGTVDTYDEAKAIIELHENGAIYVRIEPPTIFTQIADERNAQNQQWGGAEHDDQHDLLDWAHFIDHQTSSICVYATKATGYESIDPRKQLIQIAALAVAALESFDRKAELENEKI